MNCVGKTCSQVSYEFVSIDAPLEYQYTPAGGGNPQQGTLGEGNQDYINMWLVAFLVWMGFGLLPGIAPFRTVRTGCDAGCECDLGPETVTTKQYTFTPPVFPLTGGSKIRISGKFTMRVKSRVGVCTPKAGTEFSILKRESTEFLAMLPAVKSAGKRPVMG